MSAPPSARVSRRSVLKTTAIVAVSAGAAGTALATRKPDERQHPELVLLTPLQYTQLAALCEVVCPGKAGVFPSAADIDLPAMIDKFLKESDAEAVQGVIMALTIFDNALTAALTGGGLSPFSTRSAEERTAILTRWGHSDLAFQRTVAHGLGSLVNSIYWGDPRVQVGTGYAGPPDPAQFRRTYAENLVDLGALRAKPKATET